jgi:uncharacterized protein (DUF1778 family)
LPIIFELDDTDINRSIAEFIRQTEEKVHVQTSRGKLRVQSEFAVEVNKLELGSAVRELSDTDWARLYKQIGKSLKGGRLWPPRRSFDRQETWVIRIHRLRTKGVYIRLDPLEYSALKEAAATAKKNLSDFIRSGSLKLADEVTDRETLRRQQERQQEQKAASQEMKKRYVS